jgi:TIR domain
MTKARQVPEDYRYHVCLSFAGEDRDYMDKVAEELRAAGVRVFYDLYEQVDLWGKDLYVHLNDIYSGAAKYCVLFASHYYARKIWTNHEREAAQERAIRAHREYTLPARFDDTKIPGLRRPVGHVDLRKIKPPALAKMIIDKLGRRQLSNYLPPMPDLLLRSYVYDYGSVDPALLYDRASHFLEALRRTTMDEREAIIQLFQQTCPADLPKNVHMNIDLLYRLTGFSPNKLARLFAGLRSLGFYTRFKRQRQDKHHIGEDKIMVVEWHDISGDAGTWGNATELAFQMLAITDYAHYDECSSAALRRLDFSHLSSATLTMEAHDLHTGRRIPNVGKALRKLFPLDLEESTKSGHAWRLRGRPQNRDRLTPGK